MKRTIAALDSAADPPSKRPDDDSVKILDTSPVDWECSICCDLLVDPVVVVCGHDFCKHCIDDWSKRQTSVVRCPVCRKVLGQAGTSFGKGTLGPTWTALVCCLQALHASVGVGRQLATAVVAYIGASSTL